MTRKTVLFAALALAALLILPAAAAQAAPVTLGSTTQPAGSTASACGGAVIGQLTSDASTPYAVPAGGGTITQWSVNTVSATAGGSMTFVALRAAGGGNYTVVGADTETLPNPLPLSGIATFNVPTPITVAAGDTLGLYGTAARCYFNGGSTPAGDSLFALVPAGTPTAGQTLSPTGPSSPSGYTLNLAAQLVQDVDASVTAAAAPANAVSGNLAQLSSLVTNAGPATATITFTDNVPAGLTISSAIAGLGTCTTLAQIVTCTIANLAAGQSAPVAITVVPNGPGTYQNNVSVSGAPAPDPNPGNNSAGASLVVRPGPPDATKVCIVPPLARTPLAAAKRVLRGLHCRVGKIKRASSRKIHRGDVISASPSRGVHAARTKVKLKVSSGPPHKKGRGKH